MTSRLVVNSVRHTGASADGITLDSSGNVTFPANATCSGTATGFGKFTSYAVIADQKANNAISGNFVSGAWRVRDLNTELADADGIVTISNNQFTLQAGTYLIKWSCPAYGRNYHASRLRNNTDGINYAGASTYADYNSNVQNESIGAARLTIGAAKVFEVQHRCSVSGAHNNGFGVDTNFDVDYEIFTIVEIFKE